MSPDDIEATNESMHSEDQHRMVGLRISIMSLILVSADVSLYMIIGMS